MAETLPSHSSSRFIEVMRSNPPHLLVRHQRGADGTDNFQWGVVAGMPVLSLISAIMVMQTALREFKSWIPSCNTGDQGAGRGALVLAWDASTQTFDHFVDHTIPVEPLIGMLEIIKSTIVNSRLAQTAAAQQTRIVGPDGQPVIH